MTLAERLNELDASRSAIDRGEKEEAWEGIERFNRCYFGKRYTPAVAASVRRTFEARWAERWPS